MSCRLVSCVCDSFKGVRHSDHLLVTVVPFKGVYRYVTLICVLVPVCVCCVQGVFIPSQVAAASALLSSSSNLQAVLCQFFREDLVSWTSRKGKGAGGGSLHLPNETLKGLVLRNTHQVRPQPTHWVWCTQQNNCFITESSRAYCKQGMASVFRPLCL